MKLLTRADFDGLVCGAILKQLGIIDHWNYVHPKDMQEGKVEVTADDVLANVPYVPGCGMWFDHHASEMERVGRDLEVPGLCRLAPSCARVIYEYYDGDTRMPHLRELIEACDKVDSGDLTVDEVLNPKGGVLLGFIMDPRTGLGRFREFTISNLQLMTWLLDCCAVMRIDDIFDLPDVQERLELYNEQSALFEKMLEEHTELRGNVIVSDMRGVDPIYAGNRFFIYAKYPEQNVSVWIVDGRMKKNVSIAVGYSVLNRTCKADIGALCAKYGGGGHKQVGTCQVDTADADRIIEEILTALESAES